MGPSHEFDRDSLDKLGGLGGTVWIISLKKNLSWRRGK